MNKKLQYFCPSFHKPWDSVGWCLQARVIALESVLPEWGRCSGRGSESLLSSKHKQ
jgi:hypothetical protein